MLIQYKIKAFERSNTNLSDTQTVKTEKFQMNNLNHTNSLGNQSVTTRKDKINQLNNQNVRTPSNNNNLQSRRLNYSNNILQSISEDNNSNVSISDSNIYSDSSRPNKKCDVWRLFFVGKPISYDDYDPEPKSIIKDNISSKQSSEECSILGSYDKNDSQRLELLNDKFIPLNNRFLDFNKKMSELIKKANKELKFLQENKKEAKSLKCYKTENVEELLIGYVKNKLDDIKDIDGHLEEEIKEKIKILQRKQELIESHINLFKSSIQKLRHKLKNEEIDLYAETYDYCIKSIGSTIEGYNLKFFEYLCTRFEKISKNNNKNKKWLNNFMLHHDKNIDKLSEELSKEKIKSLNNSILYDDKNIDNCSEELSKENTKSLNNSMLYDDTNRNKKKKGCMQSNCQIF